MPGRDDPVLLTAEVVGWIARTYRARVDRADAEGVRLSAPALPAPETIALLGQTVAALNVSGPASRVDLDALEGLAETVREAAHRISKGLGLDPQPAGQLMQVDE